jgi:hypothetical protein
MTLFTGGIGAAAAGVSAGNVALRFPHLEQNCASEGITSPQAVQKMIDAVIWSPKSSSNLWA